MDLYKNKKWQLYIVAMAATCVKEILFIIPVVIDKISHSQSKEIYCEHSCCLYLKYITFLIYKEMALA